MRMRSAACHLKHERRGRECDNARAEGECIITLKTTTAKGSPLTTALKLTFVPLRKQF